MVVYLNGKFTAQATTGVQRVASCLIQALDTQVTGHWVLVCPPGATPPQLQRIEVRIAGGRGLPLHLWEQLVLPVVARNGLLINLAGAAPRFARRQVCLIHDAAVFDQAQAYSVAFGVWYRWLFRRLVRRAELLLTVSKFSRERLAEHLGLMPESFAVVPGGSDHLANLTPDASALDRHGLHQVRYLLAVASANPTKNLPALMCAFARLGADPGLRLVIVGGRNERVFAGRDASDPPGVIRTGSVGDAELKALYAGAVALIFPSLYEGFGLPPLEAMACGCPVAVARTASMPEVCGDAALYFDPLALEAIAHAMRQLLADAPLRDHLRQAGLVHAASYRWQASAALLLAALPAGGSQ